MFKNSIKLLTRLFFSINQTFFTQRALKGKLGTKRALQGHSLSSLQGHQKGSWALGHTKHFGTWALEHSKDTWVLGHSEHSGTSALRHLGTRTLQGHLGTQALRHSCTQALRHSGIQALGHSRQFI